MVFCGLVTDITDTAETGCDAGSQVSANFVGQVRFVRQVRPDLSKKLQSATRSNIAMDAGGSIVSLGRSTKYIQVFYLQGKMNKRPITVWITFAANILVALPFAVLLALIFFSFLQFHYLRLDWTVYRLTATLLLYI